MNTSSHDPADATAPANSRHALETLLDGILQRPERHAEIAAQIARDFEQLRATLIIDMSGFTRTTHQQGIVPFLLMIRQMHRVCCPVIVEHGGTVVKTEADNLFCLFPSVQSSLDASIDIIRRLETVNVLLPEDRHLYASVGIGWGMILNIEEHDLFGDEVNLSCKLGEDIAEKNQILLTERAREQLGPDARMAERELSISGLALRYFELLH